jgi:hypothetical protein
MGFVRNRGVLILCELDVWTAVAALLLSRFYTVYYLRITGKLHSVCAVVRLERAGVRLLRGDEAPKRVLRGHIRDIALANRAIYDQIFCRMESSNVLEKLFANIVDHQSKVGIALRDAIQSRLGGTPYVLLWARHFQKEGKKVFLLTSDSLTSAACESLGFSFPCLLPSWLSLPAASLRAMVRFMMKALKYTMMRARSVRVTSFAQEESPAGPSDLSQHEVLFFPHKGVAYGGLFLKDHYYSEDPNNPFHPSSILHLELHSPRTLGTEDTKAMCSFYSENGIPYRFFGQRSGLPLRKIHKFVTFWWRNRALARELFDCRVIAALSLLYSVHSQFVRYLDALSEFPDARIALVGFDLQFPKALSLALESQGVRTVAVQERYFTPLWGNFGAILDHYLVFSSLISDAIAGSREYAIGHVTPIGGVRMDVLHGFRNGSTPGTPKRGDEVCFKVVALDWHSFADGVVGRSALFNNYRSNREFYQDLIRLAGKYPEIKVTIRGKDDAWCGLPEFADVYRAIASTPNVEVDRNYRDFNVSYELLAEADLVIARYTSLAEEALAAAIPVFVCDYLPAARNVIAEVYDYHDGHPVFVGSYGDLEARVGRLLRRGEYMPGEDHDRMRETLYGSFYDGHVVSRLHRELRRIWRSTLPR